MTEQITITYQTILALSGGIACIAGGVTAVAKLFTPFKKLKDKVQEHEDKLNEGDEEMKELDKAIKRIEDTDKVICKSLLVLMNHEITGNSIDKLKEQRDALEEFLIDK